MVVMFSIKKKNDWDFDFALWDENQDFRSDVMEIKKFDDNQDLSNFIVKFEIMKIATFFLSWDKFFFFDVHCKKITGQNYRKNG